MKTHFIKCMLVILAMGSVSTAFGQKRSSIVNAINEWGNCKNVAITATKGNIAISEKGAYAMDGKFPPAMYDAIIEATNNKRPVNDIVLTESGKFLVLIGRNGYVAKGIPEKLDVRLKELNTADEEIISVSFNDKGDWIVVCNGKIFAAITGINDLQKIADENGRILTGYVSDEGTAIVCEKGIYLSGNYPGQLSETIKKTTFPIYRVKFTTDGAFFISDKVGDCSFGL